MGDTPEVKVFEVAEDMATNVDRLTTMVKYGDGVAVGFAVLVLADKIDRLTRKLQEIWGLD